jgi:hypothetical protein
MCRCGRMRKRNAWGAEVKWMRYNGYRKLNKVPLDKEILYLTY